MTELIFFFLHLEHLFSDILFRITLNCHKTLAVRAFDPIPTLRARPEYQLSADIHSPKAGTKLPHELALYLVWPRFFFKSTTFGYVQPSWATLNHSPSGYGVMLQTAKMDSKVAYFRPLQKISTGQVCFKLRKSTTRQYWIRFSCHFNWKTLFLPYVLNLCFTSTEKGHMIVPDWYYRILSYTKIQLKWHENLIQYCLVVAI